MPCVEVLHKTADIEVHWRCPLAGRSKPHLKLVEGSLPGRETIGPYSLREVLADHGHPQLRLGWRHGPEALQGRYAVLLLERTDRRLPSAESALLRDAARAMGARHPAVVRVRDLVGDRDGLAIVTDHVSGLSVETILDQLGGRALPRGAALAICVTLLEVLDDIHSMPREKGRHSLPAAHGDVRAPNVLLADDASVRILGYGLPPPRLVFGLDEDGGAESISATGDLWFPTPEGDQFAAGLLLLRMLAAHRSSGLILSRGRGPDPDAVRDQLRRFDLADPLLPVLLKLLASRSEHRFPGCADAAREIRRLQDDDESVVLARFAARLHEDGFQETDVRTQSTPIDDEDELATDPGIVPAVVPPPAPQDPSVTEVSGAGPESSVTVASPDVSAAELGSREAWVAASVDATAFDADTTALWTEPTERADVGEVELEEMREPPVDPTAELPAPSLDQPSSEWNADLAEEETRTAPAGAPFPRRSGGPGAVSEPGRTVPYSPAFVPRASKWRPGDDAPTPRTGPDPDLSTAWAAGLMSGTMDAVVPRPTLETPVASPAELLGGETRPFSPAPSAPGAGFESETTAIPVPGGPVVATSKRRKKRRKSRPTRVRSANRLSQALERAGLLQAVQSSWVLTLFTAAVIAMLAYAGSQIWVRSNAPEPPPPEGLHPADVD